MTTAGQRLVDLSGLPAGTAAEHLIDISVGGTTAGQRLVSRSSLPSATAADHLLDAGGAQGTLYPSVFTNQQTFYGPNVSLGTALLEPQRVDNSQTFYAATVSLGAVTLQPPVFTNASVFYAPTVQQAGGTQNLLASLFTDADIFYPAEVVSIEGYFPPAGGVVGKPIRPQFYQPLFTGRPKKRRQQDIVFLGH